MSFPPITLEALSVLDAIDTRGSFAGAAEQLNKVPSALSYIVQKLEEQLAVTLFVRQGRRSVLTPAGQHLLEEGRKVLAAVSAISEQTQTISHGWEPKIRIAIDSIFDIGDVLSKIKTFLDAHPNIEIDLREEVMNGGWEALIHDEIDLMIGAPTPVPAHQGIRAVTIASLEKVLVCSKAHPLAKNQTPLTEEHIRNHRTVVVHDSAKRIIARSSNVIEQSQHFYVANLEQKIRAIEVGIGIGFLPTNRIAGQLKSGQLTVLPTEREIQNDEITLAWKLVNKGKGLRQLTDLFIDS